MADERAPDAAASDEGDQELPFEDSLARLQELLQQLEQGDLSLEESLRSYEQGIGLLKRCYRTLDAAEERLEVLRRQADGELGLEPVRPEELGPVQ